MWKESKTYVAIMGVLVSGLMAFGVLVPEEGVAASTALTQIVGGIFGLVAVVQLVRARYKADDKPAE
jgi:hypothetical protein